MFPGDYQNTFGAGQPYYPTTTPGNMLGVPYTTVDWNDFYVPTQHGGGGARVRRPVIYVAAQLPAGNSFGGVAPRYF